MSNPTLTWTNTADRAFTPAGTNATIAELLAAIKAAIDNDSTLWQTSDYNAGNGTLEIKRKTTSSPTGDQATCRLLIFGGSIPNSAALTTVSPTAAATSLYACGSTDAATTGPSAAYSSGAPYSTTFIKGNLVCTSSDFALARTPRVNLIESVDGLAIAIRDTSNCATIIFGKLIEDASTQGLFWTCITSCGLFTSTATSNAYASGSSFTVPCGASTTAIHGQYWNGTTASCRNIVRPLGFLVSSSDPILGSSGAPVALLPCPVAEQAASSGAAFAFLGFLRQIRLGPAGQHCNSIKNGGVTQAIMFGQPFNSTNIFGMWFDQAA